MAITVLKETKISILWDVRNKIRIYGIVKKNSRHNITHTKEN